MSKWSGIAVPQYDPGKPQEEHFTLHFNQGKFVVKKLNLHRKHTNRQLSSVLNEVKVTVTNSPFIDGQIVVVESVESK
jgi:hypothetical protein